MKPSLSEQRGNVKTAGTSECGWNSGLEVYQRRAVDYERRAGEMLEKNLPHEGGRPKKPFHDARFLKLKDIGVSETQSSRWQSIDTLPEKDFEGYIRLRWN